MQKRRRRRWNAFLPQQGKRERPRRRMPRERKCLDEPMAVLSYLVAVETRRIAELPVDDHLRHQRDHETCLIHHVSSLWLRSSAAPAPALGQRYVSVFEQCVVRDANMGQQLAGGNRSWCSELKSNGSYRVHLGRLDRTELVLNWPETLLRDAHPGAEVDAICAQCKAGRQLLPGRDAYHVHKPR